MTETPRYCARISAQEYQQEAYYLTQRELAKLFNIIHSHPEEAQKSIYFQRIINAAAAKSVRLAGAHKRLAALAVDLVIILFFYSVSQIIPMNLGVFVWLLYLGILLKLKTSSIGKTIFGIYVGDIRNGKPVGVFVILTREILRILLCWSAVIFPLTIHTPWDIILRTEVFER